MLSFTVQEMKEFMENVRLKINPIKYDKMFGFDFNFPNAIFQTSVFSTEKDTPYYLLKNRIFDIEKIFAQTSNWYKVLRSISKAGKSAVYVISRLSAYYANSSMDNLKWLLF